MPFEACNGKMLKKIEKRLKFPPKISKRMTVFKDFIELKAFVGKELATTPDVTITQKMMHTFADSTLDFQWIHTDP